MTTPPSATPPTKPLALQHLMQARQNYKLYQELKQGGEYLDWAVTVLFYAALHLVQAYLVETAPSEADIPADHVARDSAIWRRLRPIVNQYSFLKTRSTWARYTLTRPKPTRAVLEQFESRQFAGIVAELGRLGITL
jgi:hypothetical protein